MFAGMLSHIDAPTIEVRVYQDGELLLRQECDRDEAVAIVDRASDSDHVYLLVHSTTSNRGPGDVISHEARHGASDGAQPLATLELSGKGTE
jgi:hypothetical protein